VWRFQCGQSQIPRWLRRSRSSFSVVRGRNAGRVNAFAIRWAVAGTHGKTTTTSLVRVCLAEGGLDPTFVIGGRLKSADSNARWCGPLPGRPRRDESGRVIHALQPMIAIVTNIDNDPPRHATTATSRGSAELRGFSAHRRSTVSRFCAPTTNTWQTFSSPWGGRSQPTFRRRRGHRAVDVVREDCLALEAASGMNRSSGRSICRAVTMVLNSSRGRRGPPTRARRRVHSKAWPIFQWIRSAPATIGRDPVGRGGRALICRRLRSSPHRSGRDSRCPCAMAGRSAALVVGVSTPSLFAHAGSAAIFVAVLGMRCLLVTRSLCGRLIRPSPGADRSRIGRAVRSPRRGGADISSERVDELASRCGGVPARRRCDSHHGRVQHGAVAPGLEEAGLRRESL